MQNAKRKMQNEGTALQILKYNTSLKQDTIKMENKRCLNTIAEEDSTGFKKQMEEI